MRRGKRELKNETTIKGTASGGKNKKSKKAISKALIIIAIIPILETLSVIIQVMYFKKTGNRIFKMAPLHHHFELSGWSENKVVRVFSVITLLVCVVGILAV